MNEKLLKYFHAVEKEHWWWEGRRQILRQHIKPVNSLKILDIGCGISRNIFS